MLKQTENIINPEFCPWDIILQKWRKTIILDKQKLREL